MRWSIVAVVLMFFCMMFACARFEGDIYAGSLKIGTCTYTGVASTGIPQGTIEARDLEGKAIYVWGPGYIVVARKVH
jgi:hypothetical protein